MEISNKRGALFLYLLGCILMLACSISVLLLGIGYIIHPESADNTMLAREKEFACVVSLIGIFCFGIALIYIIYRFVKNEPALIITQDGFVDKSTMSAIGFVNWIDVIKITLLHINMGYVGSITMIGVSVSKLNLLIENKPWYVKKLIKGNIAMGYPPITINLNSVNEKPEEVLAIMHQYWDEWKKNNTQEII